MCGGLNAPPRTPTAATATSPSAGSIPNLALAAHDVLERRQLAKANRPAGVQLLGRVADLGSHAELEAVREPRGRVDVDDRRIDVLRERLRGLLRRRDDRL